MRRFGGILQYRRDTGAPDLGFGIFAYQWIIGLIVYVVCVFVIPVDDGYVDAEFNEKK